MAHAFRAGDDGMTLLMYGTRDPNDICFYPRSGKVFFTGSVSSRGVGEPWITGTARSSNRPVGYGAAELKEFPREAGR